MSRQRRQRRLVEDDPLDGVANLFDLGIVFALGILVSLLLRAQSAETRESDATTADGGSPVDPTALEIERFRRNGAQGSGEGVRLGTAYQLDSGEIVYVPDSGRGGTRER